MKRDILYPIFLKCSSFVDDTFWRYLYEDLSYGKCPYGISLQKNYLSCYVKGKEFAYKLDGSKSPNETFQEVDVLLRERAGILSEKEKIIERARLCRQRIAPTPVKSHSQNNNNTKKDEWIQVKKKMIRDTLLEQYVLDNAKKYHLDGVVAKKVLSTLIVGLMFKTITAKDIYYQNGFITKVDGIQFKTNAFIISKDILRCKSLPVVHQEDMVTSNQRTLQSYWSTYLEELKLFK